jgi:poly-gamma-glutamate capsule biosynthesis protein CapA/YwtB (metallophosphatase superfamily)
MLVFYKKLPKSRCLVASITVLLLVITILLVPACTEQVTNVMVAVGDVMLSRTVGEIIRTRDDPRAPFLETVNLLAEADLTFCNLESPLYNEEPQNGDRMVFGADPETVEGLKYAGFDIVSLANNHFGDQGTTGMSCTFSHLDENEIEYTGAGKNEVQAREPKIIEQNGVKFAFLGYNDVKSAVQMGYAATVDKPGIAVLTRENLIQDIQYARERAHVVVVSIHWGIEYEETPTERQVTYAHLAIDSGASLVLGHHPHVIQPMEEYQDGYIFYSLGNFVFDQMWSEETRIGLIARIFFEGDRIETVETIEVTIYDSHQPVISDDGF